MDEPLVSVRGQWVAEVEPEVAEVHVAVSARDKNRDETLRRLDERSRAVLALLAAAGDAVERVETENVRIGPEFKDGRPHERIAGYSGSVRHTVTVTGFTALGDLVAHLAGLGLVDVNGPWWRLRTDSAHYRAARMAAARDAVARAKEYAEALGTRVTGLVELADSGLLSEAVAAPGGFDLAPMAMRAAGGAAEVVSLDLEPVRQVVRASVEARFRIAPPPAEHW